MRLSPEARREQLLDAAAEVVVQRGCDALTMESLGAAAGASKTLGYAYFENIDDVMVSLYNREAGTLTEGVRRAVEGHHTFEEKLRGGLSAYLDGMALKGPLLVALSGGLMSGRLNLRNERPFDDVLTLVAEVLDAEYRMGAARARAYAAIFGTIATVHAQLLWSGDEARDQVERECIDFFIGGMEAVLSTDR